MIAAPPGGRAGDMAAGLEELADLETAFGANARTELDDSRRRAPRRAAARRLAASELAVSSRFATPDAPGAAPDDGG